MTEAEGQYLYRDNQHSKERFLARFQRILGLNYSARYPAPDAVIDEAWEMLGLNRTEREVVLAIDWLREKFDRGKPGKTLRGAREHAYAVVSKEAKEKIGGNRGDAASIMGGPIADHPALDNVTRAVFAFTRHYLLTRQDLKVGDPGCEEQHRQAVAGLRTNDPQWVAEWAEIARIDASHRTRTDAAIRRERIEASHA